MSNPDARAMLESERAALDAWMAGDQSEPIVIAFHDEYCVCDVLYPTRLAPVTAIWRYFGLRLAGLMPLPSLKVFFYRLLGVKIGKGVWISPGVVIDPLYPWLIELEDNCLLGMGCHIFTHEYNATNFRIGRVRIGQGAVVGAYATVRGGVTVGAKATIGFNSYVNRDVPPGATVGGVPARILKPGQEWVDDGTETEAPIASAPESAACAGPGAGIKA